MYVLFTLWTKTAYLNEYDRFLRRIYFATRTQKRRKITVENQRLISGRSKIISRKTGGRPWTSFPFRMDGWVVTIIIGFELLTKGRDIRIASNVVRNTIPVGAKWLKGLLAKLLAKGRKS